MDALRVFVGLFSSRKNQVALATAIATLLAALGLKDYPVEVIVTVIAAFVTLGATVINSIKAEDVAAKTAAGVVAAANVQATVDATTTTVTTPGTSDVSVTNTDVQPKPPAVKPIGLV